MTPRRLVIEALALGVETGDDAPVQAQLRRADPLLRLSVVQRYNRAWHNALIVGGDVAQGSSSDSTRHLFRVATLRLLGKNDVDFTDAAQVADAYRAASPPRPRARRPWLSLGAIATLLVAGAVAGVLIVRANRPTFGTALLRRAITPPSAGAFVAGGAPLTDPVLEQTFGEDLPDFVIFMDHQMGGGEADLETRRELLGKLTAPPVMSRLGPLAAQRWQELLDVYVELASLDPESDDFDNAGARFLDTAGLFDDQLAARGLGYYLDGDVWGNSSRWHAILYSNHVEEVVIVRAGERQMRVLSLRRIDKLSVVPTLLGMRAEHLRDPLVLVDRIAEHVVELLLPALGDGQPMPLGDDVWDRTDDGARVAARAGALAREELSLAVMPDGERARRVGGIYATRRAIWRRWQEVLGTQGVTLSDLDEIYLPERAIESLRESVDDAEMARFEELEESLHDEDAAEVVRRLTAAVAASVRRHEAQHGFDAAREAPLGYPSLLVDLVGPELDVDDQERRRAKSAKAELSAYLSQLASDPVTVRLELALLARFAFDHDSWGSTESYVACIAMAAIAEHLGEDLDGPLIHHHSIDRERVAHAFMAITGHPAKEVQVAAAKAWSELFGEPLVVLR